MWVKLDDDFPDRPDVAQAGSRAAYLHVAARCWSNRHRTDSFVPEGRVGRLTDERNPADLVRRLLDAGMWVEAPGGYRLVADPQLSAEEASGISAKRSAAGRQGGISSGKVRAERSKQRSNGQSKIEAKSNPVPVPVPDPQREIVYTQEAMSDQAKVASPLTLRLRPSLAVLQAEWTSSMGVAMVGALDLVADLIGDYAAASEIADVEALGRRMVQIFSAVRRSFQYPPRPSATAFSEQWERIQEVYASGVEPAPWSPGGGPSQVDEIPSFRRRP
jgi:hypothetical protein